MAYCLMRKRFHLVVQTPTANLVAGMRWLSSVFQEDRASCRQEFERRIEARVETSQDALQPLRRSGYWGSEEFSSNCWRGRRRNLTRRRTPICWKNRRLADVAKRRRG